VWILIVVL